VPRGHSLAWPLIYLLASRNIVIVFCKWQNDVHNNGLQLVLNLFQSAPSKAQIHNQSVLILQYELFFTLKNKMKYMHLCKEHKKEHQVPLKTIMHILTVHDHIILYWYYWNQSNIIDIIQLVKYIIQWNPCNKTEVCPYSN
jgi:hypothetical protein